MRQYSSSVLTFLAGLGASIVQVFPFAGSRHQTYLLPMIAMGVSAVVSWIRARVALAIILLSGIMAPLWVARAMPENNPRTMPLDDMTSAIRCVKRMVPLGSAMFVDYQTRYVLRYYLTRNDPTVGHALWAGSRRTACRLPGNRTKRVREGLQSKRSDRIMHTSSSRPQLATGQPNVDFLTVVARSAPCYAASARRELRTQEIRANQRDQITRTRVLKFSCFCPLQLGATIGFGPKA